MSISNVFSLIMSDGEDDRAEMAELRAATKKTPRFTMEGQQVVAKCVDVYDGDTAQFVYKQNGKLFRYTCRLLGINTAEMKGGQEEKARAIVARDVLRALILDRLVSLKFGPPNDPHGRPLVEVHMLNDGPLCFPPPESINQQMITGGYAQPYTGRGEKKWKA